MTMRKAKPFKLDGKEDEANILDELLRIAMTLRAEARRKIAEAEKIDGFRAQLLEFFRSNLKERKASSGRKRTQDAQ